MTERNSEKEKREKEKRKEGRKEGNYILPFFIFLFTAFTAENKSDDNSLEIEPLIYPLAILERNFRVARLINLEIFFYIFNDLLLLSAHLSGTEEVIWTYLKIGLSTESLICSFIICLEAFIKGRWQNVFPATCPKSFEEAYLCHYYSINVLKLKGFYHLQTFHPLQQEFKCMQLSLFHSSKNWKKVRFQNLPNGNVTALGRPLGLFAVRAALRRLRAGEEQKGFLSSLCGNIPTWVS